MTGSMGTALGSLEFAAAAVSLRLVGGDDRALVVEDLPAGGGLLPEGGAAGEACVLLEGVGEEPGSGG
jgi:hypothetical protein